MKYQIRFTQGEIAGKCVPLSKDKALTIGRSHSNELKLSAPDVSGRHVVLMLTDGGVSMDNLSSRVTLVDSTPLSAAERKTLMAGQTVTMGSATAFVLECLPDDAPTAPPPTSGDEELTAMPSRPVAPPKPKLAAASDDEATNLNLKPAAPKPVAPKPAAPADDDLTIVPAAKPAAPKPFVPKPAAPVDNDMTIVPSAPAAAPKPSAVPPAAAKKPVLKAVPPAAAPKPAAPPPRPAAAPKPVAPKPAAAPKPVAPPPPETDSDSGLETVAIQTRMATAEELEVMKGKAQKKQTKRVSLIVGSAVGVLVLLVVLYRVFIYRAPENFVSWPVNEQGRMLANFAAIDSCPLKNDINVQYPELPNTTVEKGDGVVEINTFLGKYHDVPFRLVFAAFRNPASLSTNRLDDFNAWIQKQVQGNGNWNFDLVRSIAFYGEHHGVPYLTVPYSRTVNNESWCGFAVQIRFEDWTFILLKEVPTRERWHAEGFIDKVSFLAFSDRFALNQWEGMTEIQDGTVQTNLEEAKALLVRNSPSVWPKAYLLIRSALCKLKSKPDMDAASYDKAIALLKELRDNQVIYFNAQKISYKRAEGTKDKRTMASIRDNLRAVFPSEEDMRYHKIRQNKWD